MKNSGSLFLKNSQRVIICIISLFLLQCRGGSFFNLSSDELALKLRQKDYAFLDKVDFSKYRLEDAAFYAPGALYYLSYVFEDARKPDLGYKCLELQINRKEQPYSVRALVEYADRKIDAELYEDAETYITRNIDLYKTTEFADSLKRRLITSLYWQKKDTETLKLIKEFFPLTDTELLVQEPELYMFRAVTKSRLEIAGWEDEVRALFFTIRRSSLHIRLYIYLKNTDELLKKFPDYEQALFQAKHDTAAEEYDSAAALFEKTFPNLSVQYFSYASLLSEFGIASSEGKTQSSHLSVLLNVIKKLEGAVKWNAYEQAGKIANALYRYSEAYGYYKSVYDNTGDSEQKKRALWRMLTIAVDDKTINEKDVFLAYAPKWQDNAYFADAVDDLIILLLQKRDYSGFLLTIPGLLDYVPTWQRTKLSYLCGRITLITKKQTAIPVTDNQAIAYFNDVLSVSTWGYYPFLASFLLGKESVFKNKSFPDASVHEILSENEKLLTGYIDFGLNKKAYRYMLSILDEVPESFLSWVADYFTRHEYYLEAIQAIVKLSNRNEQKLSKRDFQFLYPKAYAQIIEKLAKEHNLDTTLVFSLVRRESAFDRKISSHAGAVGLSQLMPGTASWMADMMKLKDYDLHDPQDNLSIGTYYLSYLKKKYDHVPYILSAYNAGVGSLKKWQQQYGSLPDDLYVEVLDFAETRNFIKNIFSSHVIYSALYDDKPLKESTALFFRF